MILKSRFTSFITIIHSSSSMSSYSFILRFASFFDLIFMGVFPFPPPLENISYSSSSSDPNISACLFLVSVPSEIDKSSLITEWSDLMLLILLFLTELCLFMVYVAKIDSPSSTISSDISISENSDYCPGYFFIPGTFFRILGWILLGWLLLTRRFLGSYLLSIFFFTIALKLL